MRKDRQVRNHRSVTFSHSIRGAGQPGNVPARSRNAGDEPGANRVGYARDDDGNCAGCLFGGQRRRRSWADDNIRF